jgi:hypothetical protein
MGGNLSVVSSQPLPLSVVSSDPLPQQAAAPKVTSDLPETTQALGEQWLSPEAQNEANKKLAPASAVMTGALLSGAAGPAAAASGMGLLGRTALQAGLQGTVGGGMAAMGENPTPASVAKGAGLGAALGGGGELAGAAIGGLPSAAKAGQALQDVKSAAGSVPIDTSKAGDTALDLYEQSQRGAVLPKSVRQLVTRMTTPDSEPLTYAEAKDFQSNISRLSANERMNLNANTKRLVGQLNANLKDALEGAADTVGKGEQFSQAMKEYHNAMTIRGMTDAAKDALWKAAFSAAGIYGARAIWNAGQGPNK